MPCLTLKRLSAPHALSPSAQRTSHPLGRLHARLSTLLSTSLLSISLFGVYLLGTPQVSAEELSSEQEAAYQEVYTAAESSVKAGRLVEAIRIYEGSLGELKGYGKVHLRLAQLYVKRDERAWRAQVAYHYLRCAQDARFNAFMRDQLCGTEVKSRFTTLTLSGTPHRLEVITPELFAGPVQEGALLPRGQVSVRLWRSAGQPPEELTLELPLSAPLNVKPRSYLPPRPKLRGGLLGDTGSLSASTSPTPQEGGAEALPAVPLGTGALDVSSPPPLPHTAGLPRWPAYALFTLSAASVVGAITTHGKTDIPLMGEGLSQLFWGTSAAFLVMGGGWLALSW